MRVFAVAALALSVVGVPVLVPATVEEQRARLPPPAECADPIEGIWRSHKFNPGYGDWMVMTLTIRRTAPGSTRLTGMMEANFWTGGPSEAEPPPCRPGLRHYIVEQPSAGSFDPSTATVDFQALSARLRENVCPFSFLGYNPDHYTGRVDPALQEFQSLNNDGGRERDEPTVFRRIRCFEAPAPAPIASPVPPQFRRRTRSGCSSR